LSFFFFFKRDARSSRMLSLTLAPSEYSDNGLAGATCHHISLQLS